MKPIFISYSSKHRDLTRKLAEELEAQDGQGSVWWDHELESRASYSAQIRVALEAARVVMVIWTAGAMVSDYIYAEAVTAQTQSKLVNVRPADMSFRDFPEPFNVHHMDDIRGSRSHPVDHRQGEGGNADSNPRPSARALFPPAWLPPDRTPAERARPGPPRIGPDAAPASQVRGRRLSRRDGYQGQPARVVPWRFAETLRRPSGPRPGRARQDASHDRSRSGAAGAPLDSRIPRPARRSRSMPPSGSGGRRLARARPDAFLPALATSLNNLGNRPLRSGAQRRRRWLPARRPSTSIGAFPRRASSHAGSILELGPRYDVRLGHTLQELAGQLVRGLGRLLRGGDHAREAERLEAVVHLARWLLEALGQQGERDG